MTAKTIVIANNKGGTGKTTTAIAIAAGFAKNGYKTLLIDIDSQTNLSQSLRVPKETLTTYALLHGLQGFPAPVAQNLWAFPSSKDMIAAEREVKDLEQGTAINRILEPLRKDYDYIVIDTPPATGLLTINALLSSDFTLIPLQASYLALQGMGQLIELLQKIGKADNVGIALTQYERRKTIHKQLYETIKQSFGSMVFNTPIRNNVALAEAPAVGQIIYDYAPKSNGAEDYIKLTEELLKRIK